MSFAQGIRHGKEHRKHYKYGDSRAVDSTCRNHGTCSYCVAARAYPDRKRREAADEQIRHHFAPPFDHTDESEPWDDLWYDYEDDWTGAEVNNRGTVLLLERETNGVH